MSNLAQVLKDFEKDQLDEEKDHENEDDITGAVLTENDKSHYQSVQKSKLRPNIIGQRYSGVKVTRAELEASSDEESEDEKSDDENEEDDEAALLSKMNRPEKNIPENKEEDTNEDLTKLFAIQDDEDVENDDENDMEDDENDEEDDEIDTDEQEIDEDPNVWDADGPVEDGDDEEIVSDDEDIGELGDHDIFARRKEKQDSTTEKLETEQERNQKEGKGILSQLEIYDQMVKIRIRLQKLLHQTALLPHYSKITHYNQRANDQTQTMYNTARDNLCNLIESSAEIVHRLTKKESILGKRKFNSLAPDNDVSNKIWKEFVPDRQKVFDQTWESVKHGLGGNNPNVALNTVLQDTERLLNRSRAKKSFAGVRIGESEDTKTDSEQYDDMGLYQSILRNVINAKADVSNSSDPIEMTRHWLRLERMEKKQAKAVVDTKASKGRKVRYNVHQKLVGFFPKRDTATWSHQQRNQLFRGVFQ